MATARKPTGKKVPPKNPVSAPKTALGRSLQASHAATERRQAEAGYVLSLVKSLMDDSQRRGRLEAGKQTKFTQAELATVINNIDRANQLLLRWMRDYVEGR